jgi:cephalosporin-C deacetylase-like acetyl esterase
MNPYTYPQGETAFNLGPEKPARRWLRYSLDFRPAFHTTCLGSGNARGEYFRPRSGDRAPLVILLHGMGDRSAIPCKLLARRLVKKGIACFILYLSVHSSRMSEPMKKRFPRLTPEEWFESYQTSIIEVRQVIDWARTRQELDADKIGIIGISYGGFVSAIAMGVDERIDAGVFIVTGGNGEKINQRSRLSSIAKSYRRSEEEYQRVQQSYLRYLTEIADKGFENVVPERKSFLTDSMTFAHRLRQRPVLMINARWDEAVPGEATRDFWVESGRPAIVWLPATHASVWLWYPKIRRKITDFLMSAFGWSLKEN